MTARSGFTVSNGATIATTWGNGVRDHIVPIGTTDDVSSEGQLASNTSTNKVVVHDGTSARTLVAYGEWDTWSVGVEQGTGGMTSAAGGSTAYYTMIGRTVHWSMDLDIGSVVAPVAGSAILIGLPVASLVGFTRLGSGYFLDASTGIYYPCLVTGASSTSAAVLAQTSTASTNLALGSTGSEFSGAIAAGDIIRVGGSYQAAA